MVKAVVVISQEVNFAIIWSRRKTDKNISPVHAASFGALARALAATTFLPFTVVKTRYEVQFLFWH